MCMLRWLDFAMVVIKIFQQTWLISFILFFFNILSMWLKILTTFQLLLDDLNITVRAMSYVTNFSTIKKVVRNFEHLNW